MTITPPSQSYIEELGRRIFTAIGEEQPSAFTKNGISARIMEWSLTRPDFKLNMFRLVDVLPTLKTNSAIAQHVKEYLSGPARTLGALAEWGVNTDPSSLRAKATAFTVKKSVEQMARMFIAGESPIPALKALRDLRRQRLAFTVDLLGEFSLSEKEALVYSDRYHQALQIFGQKLPEWPESAPIVPNNPGCSTPLNVSVKLSALYSQCSPLNFERSVQILSERLSNIVREAQKYHSALCIDAEDVAHNPIIYATFMAVFGSKEFRDFPYPGIVVQAYASDSQTRLNELLAFAKKRGAPIAIRLVKGAYWDYETVLAAQNNWASPLFSTKIRTDRQYELLTRVLLDNHKLCFPAFGSHNIRSLSYACCCARNNGLTEKDFELQMLYGMAEPIARAYARQGYLTRLYVPLGEMLPGMGYFVRRLLENTSNESFLRHTFFDSGEIEQLLSEPQE